MFRVRRPKRSTTRQNRIPAHTHTQTQAARAGPKRAEGSPPGEGEEFASARPCARPRPCAVLCAFKVDEPRAVIFYGPKEPLASVPVRGGAVAHVVVVLVVLSSSWPLVGTGTISCANEPRIFAVLCAFVLVASCARPRATLRKPLRPPSAAAAQGHHRQQHRPGQPLDRAPRAPRRRTRAGAHAVAEPAFGMRGGGAGDVPGRARRRNERQCRRRGAALPRCHTSASGGLACQQPATGVV